MRRLFWLLLLTISLAGPVSGATPKKTPTSAKPPAKSPKGVKSSAKKKIAHKLKTKKQAVAKQPTKKSAAVGLQNSIVGKWAQIGGEDTVEFTKEGMMIAANSQVRIEGKYTISNNGRMEVDLGLGHLTHGPMLRKVALQGEDLTITDDHGLVMKYKRLK